MRLLGRRREPVAGGVAALYARVIDGDSLWLAVTDHPPESRVALVHGTDEVPLEDDAGADDGAVLSVRADLTDRDLAPGTTYRICVGGGAGDWTAVTSAPLPDLQPIRTPASRDGCWRHELARADDGVLTLTRKPLEPTVPLLGIGDVDESIGCLVPADVDGVVLVGPDAEVERPVGPAPTGSAQQFEVAVEDLPGPSGASYRAHARTPSGRRPIVRRRHDLARPGRALALPEIPGPDGEPALRMRFDEHGALMFRRPDGTT